MTPTFEIGPLELQYAHPFGLSRWTTRKTTNVLVRMEMEGHVGWGEGAPNRRYGETSDQDILFLEKWAPVVFENGDPLSGLLTLFEQTHVPGSAAAALDMAIHDWLGHRDALPVYAVLGFPAPAPRATSFTIGIDEPAVVAEKTREAEAYEVLKIKVGTEHDEALIRAVRSVTAKPLRVDANEGWKDREAAARSIEWLVREGVELVEQPFPAGRLEDVAWLRDRSAVPIFADEDCRVPADIARLTGVYDGVNIKLDKCGGLLQAALMIKEARENDLQVMIGCMIGSSLSTTAAFHLVGLAEYIDLDGHLLLAQDPFEGLACTAGRLHLLPGSGIGARPIAQAAA